MPLHFPPDNFKVPRTNSNLKDLISRKALKEKADQANEETDDHIESLIKSKFS